MTDERPTPDSTAPEPTAPTEPLSAEQLEKVEGAAGGGAGKVNVQDLSFTHHYDVASPR